MVTDPPPLFKRKKNLEGVTRNNCGDTNLRRNCDERQERSVWLHSEAILIVFSVYLTRAENTGHIFHRRNQDNVFGYLILSSILQWLERVTARINTTIGSLPYSSRDPWPSPTCFRFFSLPCISPWCWMSPKISTCFFSLLCISQWYFSYAECPKNISSFFRRRLTDERSASGNGCTRVCLGCGVSTCFFLNFGHELLAPPCIVDDEKEAYSMEPNIAYVLTNLVFLLITKLCVLSNSICVVQAPMRNKNTSDWFCPY